MKKIFQLLSVAAVAVSSLALTGCAEGDDFNYDRNGLLITGTESTPDSLLCAALVAAESGRMRWYMV